MTGPTFDHPWLIDALLDPTNGWSVGTFGAIAEFTRDPGEPATQARQDRSVALATGRGALRLQLDPSLTPLAYETPSADRETWNHAVALCLPVAEAGASRRRVLTRLGPDRDAIRPEDRDAILFDMGLGLLPVDVCIRTRDPELIGTLDAETGRSLMVPSNPAMGAIVAAGPHRVFVSRLGRAEVYQPIPAAGGRSPDGPHTHVLPKLLRSGRTHAATTPIPEGLVPCAHLYPPNPQKDAFGRRTPFDRAAHATFQAWLETFGDPDLVALKRACLSAISRGQPPGSVEVPDGKHARAAVRVAIRQARFGGASQDHVLAWSAALDPSREPVDDGEDEQPAH